MEYYLSPYIGDGRNGNMFLPANSESAFHSIDLRPNCTRREGWCFLASPVKRERQGAIYLGNELDEEYSQAFQWKIESFLGIEFRDKTLRRFIVETMFQGRFDGTRWKPLLPERYWWRIYLAEKIWEFPVIRGGTTVTESFNTADSDTLGPDNTWTEIVGDIDIVSNRAQSVTNDVRLLARCDTTLATADHYAQASVDISPLDADNAECGTVLRKDNTATVTYYSCLIDYFGDRSRINKTVASSVTALANPFLVSSVNPGTPVVSKGQISGSNLSHFIGAQAEATATDSAIVANTYTGLCGVRSTSGTCLWDSFEAGDVATSGMLKRHPGMSVIGFSMDGGCVA